MADNKTVPGWVSIQFYAPPRIRDLLDDLADAQDARRGGIVARALDLYDAISTPLIEGAVVILRHPDGTEQEIRVRKT